MATARGRAEWGRTVVTVQWVVAAFNGQQVNPSDIAPAWVFGGPSLEPRPKTPEDLERDMQHTGDFMDAAFLAAFGRGRG